MARIAAKLAARGHDGDIIDNKARGQPFKDTGKKDSDSAEWDHKVRIFTGARFGWEILEATSWAKRQKKPILKVVRTSGEDADDVDQTPDLELKLHHEYDPTSSMRRLTILGYVQNPNTCNRIEDLGLVGEETSVRRILES